MRTILILFFVCGPVFAKGLDGKWKVKSYKISGEEPAWTSADAEEVSGKTVSFSKDKMKLGEASCKMKVTPMQEGRRWTAGETNPCSGDPLKGMMVYSLSYEECSARFPGFVAMVEGGKAVAFGEGVSFCLEKK